MCVQFTVYIVAHNNAQNRPDNFPSYPPDNHHSSDDVYLRERGLPDMDCHGEDNIVRIIEDGIVAVVVDVAVTWRRWTTTVTW